jgi:hypothetical protein
MILDSSKVSMADGECKQAIDLLPGREVLSYHAAKMARTRITDKSIGSGSDVIGLVFNNGQKLCGTRTHTVAVFSRKGRIQFKEFADVKIGDTVRGERAGVPILVSVVGLLYFPRKEVRLVGFETVNGRPYVAEGVFCK